MTFREIIDKGLLEASTSIRVNDEDQATYFGVAFSEERKQEELVLGFADAMNMFFPIDLNISIDGLDVLALNERGTEYVLSFEKTSSVDPDDFCP
jgi:hypothetical protein